MQNLFMSEGNLGDNPTLKMVPDKQTGEQQPILEFSVRFNVDRWNPNSEAFEDNGGFWGKVSLWGRRAEIFNVHLKKGCRVLVIGEERQRPYIANKGEYAGQERISTEIRASHVAIVPLGIDEISWSSKADQQTLADNQSFDDDIPI
jgi:single-strand DNA-binding protein